MAVAQVIKCRLQVQGAALASGAANLSTPKYKGPIDCAIKTVKTEGISGLFRGLTALLARDIPFNALFFGFYDAYCKLILSLPLPWRDLAHKSDMTALEFLVAVRKWCSFPCFMTRCFGISLWDALWVSELIRGFGL